MNRLTRGRFCSLILAIALLLAHGRTARAGQSTRLVLGQQKPDDPEAERIVNRLAGELSADGIDVATLDDPQDGQPPALAERAREAGAAVGAALVVAADGQAIELTLVDASSGRVSRRRIDREAGKVAPEVLARRSVDLLRASLLDFVIESLRAATVASPSAGERSTLAAKPAPSHLIRLYLEGGAGVLASFQGVGPALVPVVRIGASASPWWRLRATAAWLGTRPTVVAGTGSADIEQGVAVLEAVVSPLNRGFVRPSASFGLGGYYMLADGTGIPPYVGTRTSSLALALDAGVGLSARVASSLDIALELQALFTMPGLAVRFLDDDAARAGRPSILATLTLSGWL